MEAQKGKWLVKSLDSTGQLTIKYCVYEGGIIHCCDSSEDTNKKEVEDLIDLLKMWKISRKNNL